MIVQRVDRDRDDDQLGFDGGEWYWWQEHHCFWQAISWWHDVCQHACLGPSWKILQEKYTWSPCIVSWCSSSFPLPLLITSTYSSWHSPIYPYDQPCCYLFPFPPFPPLLSVRHYHIFTCHWTWYCSTLVLFPHLGILFYLSKYHNDAVNSFILRNMWFPTWWMRACSKQTWQCHEILESTEDQKNRK